MQHTKTRIGVLVLAANGACFAQTPPAATIPEPAPNGISATSRVLFSQPYCDTAKSGAIQTDPSSGKPVPRGVYIPGTTTPLVPLAQSSVCTENYFVVSSGLG